MGLGDGGKDSIGMRVGSETMTYVVVVGADVEGVANDEE